MNRLPRPYAVAAAVVLSLTYLIGSPETSAATNPPPTPCRYGAWTYNTASASPSVYVRVTFTTYWRAEFDCSWRVTGIEVDARYATISFQQGGFGFTPGDEREVRGFHLQRYADGDIYLESLPGKKCFAQVCSISVSDTRNIRMPTAGSRPNSFMYCISCDQSGFLDVQAWHYFREGRATAVLYGIEAPQ